MAKLNPKPKKSIVATSTTFGGAKSVTPNDVELLRRSVNSCMLFEDEFYEDGQSISKRIATLVHKVPIAAALDVATEAKVSGIRHAPLLVARYVLNHPQLTFAKDTTGLVFSLLNLIRRPDEICDLLALYWKNGKTPISGLLKRVLALSFCKFNFKNTIAKIKFDFVM
jgi:hypothetical protein